MSLHNEQYPSKVLTKNINATPRTLSEAKRDVEYACAITMFKTDLKLTLDFLGNAIIGGVYVLGAVVLVYGVYAWLTKG